MSLGSMSPVEHRKLFGISGIIKSKKMSAPHTARTKRKLYRSRGWVYNSLLKSFAQSISSEGHVFSESMCETSK